jgi:hypothetical protein
LPASHLNVHASFEEWLAGEQSDFTDVFSLLVASILLQLQGLSGEHSMCTVARPLKKIQSKAKKLYFYSKIKLCLKQNIRHFSGLNFRNKNSAKHKKSAFFPNCKIFSFRPLLSKISGRKTAKFSHTLRFKYFA